MDPMLGSKLRRDVRCNLMPMRQRSLLLLIVAVLSLGLLAGCGGGDDNKNGETADSSTDVDQLLKETFSNDQQIKSGKVDIGASLAGDGQTFTVKVTGPFQSGEEGELPQADLDLSFEGSGQNVKLGGTLTEDRVFVNFDGTEYELPGALVQQLKAQYEQQAKAAEDEPQSLAGLGLDPSRWLTNAENAGEADVGGTETIKITGDVDVPKLLDDVNNALAKLRSLGGASAGQLPDQLSEADKQQAQEAIKSLSTEVYTGAEDKILRRLVVAMKLEAEDTGPVDLKFDMQFLDVNEDQEIEAPSDAKPFSELASKLEGLGLGGLGGLGGAPGSGSGSGGGGGATQENLEKYSDCIQQAAGDNEKIRKCADLLTP
jgi:hypothetical protein